LRRRFEAEARLRRLFLEDEEPALIRTRMVVLAARVVLGEIEPEEGDVRIEAPAKHRVLVDLVDGNVVTARTGVPDRLARVDDGVWVTAEEIGADQQEEPGTGRRQRI